MRGAVLLATEASATLRPGPAARTLVTTAALFRADPAAGAGAETYLVVAVDERDDQAFAAAAEAGLAGVWLTRCGGLADIERTGARLAVAEARRDRPEGSLGIVASVGTTAGVVALSGLSGGTRRLRGLALNEGALRRELGLPPGRSAAAPCRQARAMLVLAAAAAGVPAVDAVTDETSARAVEAAARLARDDGFAAKLAAGRAQITPIERAFA